MLLLRFLVVLLLVLTEGLGGALHGQSQGGLVGQVLADLLGRVGVEDHANDATGEVCIVGAHARVQVLPQELLLGLRRARTSHILRRDDRLLGRLLLDWNWHLGNGHLLLLVRW